MLHRPWIEGVPSPDAALEPAPFGGRRGVPATRARRRRPARRRGPARPEGAARPDLAADPADLAPVGRAVPLVRLAGRHRAAGLLRDPGRRDRRLLAHAQVPAPVARRPGRHPVRADTLDDPARWLPRGGRRGLWGILAPLAALVFSDVRDAARWYAAWVWSSSARASRARCWCDAAADPTWFTTTMLALNIVVGGAVVFILLAVFARSGGMRLPPSGSNRPRPRTCC